MTSSLRAELLAVEGKKPARAALPSDVPGKCLALALGRVVERALALAGLTKDQASREMGYANASVLSRWVSGDECPQLARLWSVPVLRPALVQALAESAGMSVEVETTVRLRRQVA